MSKFLWTDETLNTFKEETNKRIKFFEELKDAFVTNESNKIYMEAYVKNLSKEKQDELLNKKAQELKVKYSYFLDVIDLLKQHLDFAEKQYKWERQQPNNEKNKEIKA